MGRIVSVNVAKPRLIHWKGRDVRTGFLKRPVAGAVRVGFTNLAGDQQADLRVHGGPTMAVYVYPSEHYADWTRRLGVLDLPWGSFGENLTIEGFHESEIRRGDTFRAGDALLQVTKPREPCYKMNVRFQRDDAVRLFAEAEWPGFYCRVIQEGDVYAGATFERLQTDEQAADLVQIFRQKMRRA